MAKILPSATDAEFAADRAAVAATNFCSLWPAGKQVLTTLAAAVKSAMIKGAINVVIGAGDAYCGTDDTAGSDNPETAQDVLVTLRAAGINSMDDLARDIVAHRPRELAADHWIVVPSYVFTS